MHFENTEVFGFQAALRILKLFTNTAVPSDSTIDRYIGLTSEAVIIGQNDMNLIHNLLLQGESQFNFLSQINVWVDISAPIYWWEELSRSNTGKIIHYYEDSNHIIQHEFTQSMFEDRYMSPSETLEIITKLNSIQEEYALHNSNEDLAGMQICIRKIKALLPASYIQKCRWSTNYAVLRNLWYSTADHSLSEWTVDFGKWIALLPYSEELIQFSR